MNQKHQILIGQITTLDPLFENGHFLRLPSIFVSADRYSAIGLIQFYLAFFLLLNQKQNKPVNIFWILFNFISGFIAMFISGARSRLIIVIAVFADSISMPEASRECLSAS